MSAEGEWREVSPPSHRLGELRGSYHLVSGLFERCRSARYTQPGMSHLRNTSPLVESATNPDSSLPIAPTDLR